MTARRRTAAALTAVLTLLGLQFALGAGPASAAEASTIAFVTASPVQTAFGGNWNAQLVTRFADPASAAIPGDQATVSVYISGTNEPLAERLPILPDGTVYVSASAAHTLAPGEHQLTAEIVPQPNSYVAASQTTTPLTLQVTSYAVVAGIQMDDASVAAETPVVEATLTGQFVDTTGGVPAGTWAITVTSGGTTVLETEVAQEAGTTEALRYEITEKLDRGKDYTVAATFAPVEALAAGLEVTQPSDLVFHTPGGGLADPIPYPLWLLIVTCLVPLALAAAAIVLTVQVSRRSSAPAGAVGETGPRPVTPEPVIVPDEPAWDPFATTTAATEAPTQVLPPVQAPVQAPVVPQSPERPPGEATFTEVLQGVQPPAVRPAVVQPPAAEPPQAAPGAWSLSQDEDADPEDPPR